MTTNTSQSEGAILISDLLQKCHALLDELNQFCAFLVDRKKEHAVEIKPFRNSVLSELRSLEKLSTADPTTDRTIHTLRSSNLPFYTAVWTAAKQSQGLVTFSKRFYWSPPPNPKSPIKKRCALVDIVARDGAEWIKVSTITESRLLFELAKASWEEGTDSSDNDDGGDEDGLRVNGNGTHTPLSQPSDSGDHLNDDPRIELLTQARDLQKASLATKIRYKHPQIHFVLPKIHADRTPQIDTLLSHILATGATVQTASSPTTYPTPLSNIFPTLLTNPLSTLTPTLNIDCTILLALVSDLSHATISPSPHHHRAITRQMDLEAQEHLLPSSLYPAMAGRALVCTTEAARRMREIVTLIGTPAEKARTDLLLGEHEDSTPAKLRAAFQEQSAYEVPADWKLPVRVVEAEVDMTRLPPVAGRVAELLSGINRSVFLYGWSEGCVTVSSNRTVVRLIEGIVEAEEEVGPGVWLCGTARSLVGKEKGRSA